MPRIAPVTRENAHLKAQPLLDNVQQSLGIVPNLMATLAVAPAALDGYLALSGALAKGALTAQQREQIALTIAQANSCDYCLSAHTTIGRGAGLDDAALLASRRAEAPLPETQALLTLAAQIVETRGQITDTDLRDARAAGLSDSQIVEVVSHVALNIFTNYLNHVAATVVDFPAVSHQDVAATHAA